MNYLILQYPGHNWVYYQSADKLAIAELEIACNSMKVNVEEIEIKKLANIRYISFKCDDVLSDNDLKILSTLSFVFALFKKKMIIWNPLSYPYPFISIQK